MQRAFWGCRLQGIIAPTTMGIVGFGVTRFREQRQGLVRSKLPDLVAECLLSMGGTGLLGSGNVELAGLECGFARCEIRNCQH